jgi:hypothetical protein
MSDRPLFFIADATICRVVKKNMIDGSVYVQAEGYFDHKSYRFMM